MDSKKALKILRSILDEETYYRVMEELAGTTVYFPSSGSCIDREERNLQIKDDYYSGKYDISDIARKYNLSISRIYKIIQSK